MLGLPSGAEDAILIICGIVLLISSLILRREIPHKKNISKESTSFSENGSDEIKKKEIKKEDEVIEELESAEHEEEIWDGRKL